jgi:glutathione reductase (NADPH)
MPDHEFDLIAIGAGSGGVAATRRAAAHGARVALCEADSVGGTCVLRGCVPKKLLMYGSQYREEIADARGFGYDVAEPSFSWSKLIAAKDAEIARLSGVYAGLLRDENVTLIAGRARLVDAHTVEVAGRRYSAQHVLIATGSRPVLPELPGSEHGISSNEALELPELPRRLIVVGGGYVGVELACIVHAFGSEVTLLVRGDRLLPGFDRAASAFLATELQRRGLRLVFGAELRRLDRNGSSGPGAQPQIEVTLAAGDALVADAVLFAIGRAPNTEALGLAQAGVVCDARGAVKVDSYSRSNLPSVHAVGDCTDRLNLTPVAIAEGRALADTLFGGRPTAVEHVTVPSAVFGQPPLAAVGLSEEQARARGQAVDLYVKNFRPLKHALTGREVRTMMKLVVAREGQRVLGVHIVGPDAPEIIQGFAVALRCGVTKPQLDDTIGLHPTAAEELVMMRHRQCGPFDD